MKVAIIILGNSWICPYVNTYKRIFEKLGYAYDVILWDRDGSDASAPIRFCSKGANLDNPLSKAVAYVRYSQFIKKSVQKNKYDRLIVSGPHLAILLSSFLRKKYKGRYIIDYRDISIEQNPLLSGIYSKTLANSYCNVVSSQGFKKYLPQEYKYFISHNFDVDAATVSLKSDYPTFKRNSTLQILTIGYIRNYCSNVKVIQSLGGNSNYCLKFSGRGDADNSLREYALSHSFSNVEFTGFYDKKEEGTIVEKCDFINIFFPDDIKHSTIMSNRFYLALVYKKPMIVTAGSTQATLVRDFQLGVVVEDCTNLDAEIRKFISDFDYVSFCERCNELLALFVDEHCSLEHSITTFMQA